ncbi:MAG: DUF1553 domain-containing protein [Rhodothermaceae bacterium]|nr:DUF1553 domain-containing protein [Rhodothermaceae bacterium]
MNPSLATLAQWFLLGAFIISVAGCKQEIPADIAEAYDTLPATIDFNQHIRPILADRCFACHGPDDNTREAELRLDLEEDAFARLQESKGKAFVKGNYSKSVAWQRIVSDDHEFQMPPPESNLTLTAEEKARITKWIEQGAEWKDHWAFIPPEHPEVPTIDPAHVISNPIDNFVVARLVENGFEPSPLADKERLIRRVSLDLTGLPPTLDAIDRFVADTSPEAYEKVVDALLASDAYAERMAMEWLDVSRYADTQGMHSDLARYTWPWRDWVIEAFKDNMPYDDFITVQLAGDLLPNATKEQKLATAFLRNHPTTAEGGAINEEFRQKYVQDRTNTTATAFLGLTMECAACHDHKFDPISQKEYYQMTAFFDNVKELGMQAEISTKEGYSSGPTLLMPDAETEAALTKIDAQIDSILTAIEALKANTDADLNDLKASEIEVPTPKELYPFESVEEAELDVANVHRIVHNTPIDKIVDGRMSSLGTGNPEIVEGMVGNAIRLKKERDLVFLKDVADFEVHEPFSAGAWIKMEKENANQTVIGNSGELGNGWRGWDLFIDPENRLTLRIASRLPHNYIQVTSDSEIPLQSWQHVFFTYDGSGRAAGIRLYINGQQVTHFTNYDRLYKSILHNWGQRKGWDHKPIMVGRSGRFYTGENGVFEGAFDQIRVYHDQLTSHEVSQLVHNHAPNLIQPSALGDKAFQEHLVQRNNASYHALQSTLRAQVGERISLLNDVPEIMVMEELPEQRPSYILDRGLYDAPTEEVQPATPAAVLSFANDLPKNRLGLAQWLTDEANPLTARVAVNRYWQMIFGRGLVNTPHDFGTQGALPSHPALLDWLAIEFITSGWDVKHLLKTIIMSATYRQSSAASTLHLERDPQNILLARGPSYRLPAETIRDIALASSGLLTQKVGGSSVKPYQPEGLWAEKTGRHNAYKHDEGESLYRRSMYTYIRRTTPHPAMIAFDAPDRSVCTVQRENTNTPLQALVLMNDPQFVEAARVLAQRMQQEGGDSLAEQTSYAFRLVTGRTPNDMELSLFKDQYGMALEKYRKHPDDAQAILAIGEYPLSASLNPTNTAALTLVTSTMLNHDEAYMKR